MVDANEESRAFAKKFRAKHGFDPDLYSGFPYAAVFLIKHAIETAKSTDPEAMRQALMAGIVERLAAGPNASPVIRRWAASARSVFTKSTSLPSCLSRLANRTTSNWA